MARFEICLLVEPGPAASLSTAGKGGPMSLTHLAGIVAAGVFAILEDIATEAARELIATLIRLPFTPRTRRRPDRGMPTLPRGDRREDGTPFRASAR